MSEKKRRKYLDASFKSRVLDHKICSQRISRQVRMLMDLWRLVNIEGWNSDLIEQFHTINQRLKVCALDANDKETLSIVTKISANLPQVKSQPHEESKTYKPGGREKLSGKKLEQLSNALQQLSRQYSRDADDNKEGLSQSLKNGKPVYIALQDERVAVKLMLQLEYFGCNAEVFPDQYSFKLRMKKDQPSIVVMDADFTGKMHFGLDLVESFQAERDSKIPVVFWSPDKDDIFTRLKAIRAGCVQFMTGKLDPGVMIEALELEPTITPPVPYRVLLIESCKDDAAHIEAALSKAGVISQTIHDPMLIWDELEDFQPDLIMLETIMPGCSSMEITTIIRQQERHLSTPIIFLGSDACSEMRISAFKDGADDLIKKPVNAQLLAAMIKAKCEHSRSVMELLQTDSLTGLLNHTSILGQLDESCREAEAFNKPLCFAMIDIDHFKTVNDRYGHPVGDRVIKNLALLLKHRLRATDYSGRYGGEEFCVVLPDTKLEDAHQIFDELRMRLAQSKQITDAGEFSVSFSCGIVAFNPKQPENLTILADQALYSAKEHGRNQVCCYTREKTIIANTATETHSKPSENKQPTALQSSVEATHI